MVQPCDATTLSAWILRFGLALMVALLVSRSPLAICAASVSCAYLSTSTFPSKMQWLDPPLATILATWLILPPWCESLALVRSSCVIPAWDGAPGPAADVVMRDSEFKEVRVPSPACHRSTSTREREASEGDPPAEGFPSPKATLLSSRSYELPASCVTWTVLTLTSLGSDPLCTSVCFSDEPSRRYTLVFGRTILAPRGSPDPKSGPALSS
mmetsp:Transcript_10777/g.32910  ORF Transcript_10777/g.32910 Transcript_10777/m.32910 type:complete len:212 (-) Transcript_10777:845-1480(-)